MVTSISKEFDDKNHFFAGYSLFKLNDLGLAVGKTLKFYTRVAKRLKLKVKVTGANLVCVVCV